MQILLVVIGIVIVNYFVFMHSNYCMTVGHLYPNLELYIEL